MDQWPGPWHSNSLPAAQATAFPLFVARATEPCVGYCTYIIPYLQVYYYTKLLLMDQ